MICKGTKKIQGCGEEKPISDFRKTRKWHENVCRECTTKHRREQYRAKINVQKIINGAW